MNMIQKIRSSLMVLSLTVFGLINAPLSQAALQTGDQLDFQGAAGNWMTGGGFNSDGSISSFMFSTVDIAVSGSDFDAFDNQPLVLSDYNPSEVWRFNLGNDFSFEFGPDENEITVDSSFSLGSFIRGTGTITDNLTGQLFSAEFDLTANGLGFNAYSATMIVGGEIVSTPELSASVAPASIALLFSLMLMGVERRRKLF